MTNMRTVISAAIMFGLADPALAAGKLDLTNPDDILKASAKVSCSLVDGKPTIYWWEGKTYGRRPGERDRHLFNVQGMNIRACKIFNDPKRGFGYRSVSREVMFHLDPKTNEVLRTWKNPWTGEEVEVIQVNNDPVNMRQPTYARDENGKPTARFRYFEHDGSFLSGGGAARLFYDNPLAGDYQEYVGGTYHAMEFGTDTVNMEQLLDADTVEVTDAVLSWARVSKWLPWMKMGDRDGVIIYHTAGIKVPSFEDLPEPMKGEIKKNYPIYQQPPPLDDARPNETTWTVTKKFIDAKRAKEGGAKPAGE
jgi:hypothetical protein